MASHHSGTNDYSLEPHHFFKTLLEDTIRSDKLGIPLKFARDYGNSLSSPVFIKVPNGGVWKLELTKSDGKMWLQNGWQNFVKHYSLESGHFLVFRYEGNCHFHVLIFDRSATEIEYPNANDNDKIQLRKVKIEESEDDEPELQCPRPHKMMRANPSDRTDESLKFESMAASGFNNNNNNGFSAGEGEMRSTEVCRVQRVKSDEKSIALKRVSNAFKPANPFFMVFMQPSYVALNSKHNCCLAIPTEFSKKYLKDQGDVVLSDSNGNTWAAEYSRTLGSSRRTYVKLCNGWGAFVRDKNLQFGDVCAFELINFIEITFKVFIFGGKKADFHGSRAFNDVFCPAKREAGSSSTHRGSLKEPFKAPETAFRRAMIARERALQRALAFTSENPFFVVVLQPSYVRTHALCISNHFARKHFKSTLTNVDVNLCLPNGKSWMAEYRQRSKGSPKGRICNGWKAFVKDNNLKAGDVCVLEMTDDTKISFTVFIFQAIADANCHLSKGVSQKPTGLTSLCPKAAREKASMLPVFRKVVLSLHLKEQRMGIPFRFVEQYFKPDIQMVILQVAGRSWPVKITSNPRHRIAKLTSGWIQFARENFLREGDICVYELDTASHAHGLLKVSISRSCQ